MTHTSPMVKLSAYEQASAMVAAGISVVPIRRDGTKAPAGSWKTYQQRLPTDAELRDWYDHAKPLGIGTVCGKVSGSLELLDFDHDAATTFPAWIALVETRRAGLAKILNVIRTPSGGFHVRYQCPEAINPGNLKLAMAPDPAAQDSFLTLIETRGEGGQALAPGCPPECHPTGGLYLHHSGPPITELPTITAAEREVLLHAAQSRDRSPPPPPPKVKQQSTRPTGDSGLRPGEHFCTAGPSWDELLGAFGWACIHHRGDTQYWRRPGKTEGGWSATTGHCRKKETGHELFAVFSSNAHPFPGPHAGKGCSVHDKFAVYTLLAHAGDFRAAARALADRGYGQQRRRKVVTQ